MSTPSLAELPIRRLTLHDLHACADLSEGRSWPRDEHRWALLLTAGTVYGIDDPQGGLVGTSVLTYYGSAGGPDLGAVGMVLVAEPHARQGVGRRLMRHIIEAAGATPLTLSATPQGRPLYEQLGFKAIGHAQLLRGRFTPAETTATTCAHPEVITRPAVADDLSTIVRLDHKVFGVDRTHMITRLPAFGDRLRVAESGGEIIGYAALWPSTTFDVIGPLVAQDVETAKALFTSLATGAHRPLSTTVDPHQGELLTWLTERGLAPDQLDTIMAYGISELPGDRTRNFAPMTNATG